MDHKKADRENAVKALLAVFILLIIGDYLLYNGFVFYENKVFYKIVTFFQRVNSKILLIRIGYLFLLSGFILLVPRFKAVKNMTTGKKSAYLILASITTLLFLIGYQGSNFYNLYIYPAVFFLNIIFVTKAITALKANLKDEELFKGLSNKKTKDYSYTIPSNGHTLTIHKPFFHIWVEGGQGSGKSATLMNRFIYQSIQQGMPGFIYDYEGDPLHIDHGLPLMTNLAYTAVNEYRTNNKAKIKSNKPNFPNLKLAFVNFTDLSRTVRLNILSPKYIKSKSQIFQITSNLFANLSSEAKGGSSNFWKQYGESYINSIILNLWINYPDYCTLPHALMISSLPFKKVLPWIIKHDNISETASPLISAFEGKAESTLAGATVSGQVPFQKLFTDEIFWVLSKDDFDLNITHPNNPTVFCLGNSPELKEALAPVIAAVSSVILNNMNRAGNLPSFFSMDEFPTVKLLGIDHMMATARKHKISVHLALQYFSQAMRDYDEKNAKTLRSAGGNVFLGYTRDEYSLKYYSDIFGDIKKKEVSYTTNPDQMSMSESMQKEKALKQLDIASLQTGEFTGLIADGKPAYFKAKFDEFTYNTSRLPIFSLPAETENENINKEILSRMVKRNYQNIKDESQSLLS